MPVNPELVRHLDDAVRAGIESSRDSWSARVELSTLTVVIGCIAEVPEVLHEFFPRLFRNNAVRFVKLAATLGLFLVIVGVAGELVFAHLASRYEGELQELNATLFHDAQAQIASTERDTADAQRKTAVVQQATQVLKSEADTQRAIAGTANLRAAQANERAAHLEVEAASLHRGVALLGDRSRLFDDHKNLMAFGTR